MPGFAPGEWDRIFRGVKRGPLARRPGEGGPGLYFPAQTGRPNLPDPDTGIDTSPEATERRLDEVGQQLDIWRDLIGKKAVGEALEKAIQALADVGKFGAKAVGGVLQPVLSPDPIASGEEDRIFRETQERAEFLRQQEIRNRQLAHLIAWLLAFRPGQGTVRELRMEDADP